MAEIKISLKLGQFELEFDGPEEFVKDGLTGLIECVSSLGLQDIAAASVSAPATGQSEITSAGAPVGVSSPKLSTTDFAAKLSVKSGTDLVMAAAAHLHLIRGLEDFRRGDILTEMRSAKAFYKLSYGSNLSKSLETLVKSGRLQNPRSDTYALPYNEAISLKRLL